MAKKSSTLYALKKSLGGMIGRLKKATTTIQKLRSDNTRLEKEAGDTETELNSLTVEINRANDEFDAQMEKKSS